MQGDASADVLSFRDLGPLEVHRAGRPVALGGARLAAALSLLLVNAGRQVSVDALTEAMWGEVSPARSSSTLDSHVWRLRKALEPDRRPGAPSAVLVREPGGYRLVADPATIDSRRFAQVADEARALLAAGRPREAGRAAERALALWRGRPYPTVADEPWATAAVARLEELRDQVRELLVEALLAAGAPDQALLEVGAAVAETPLRERLWSLRMLAQHRLGRPEEALRTYQQVRAVLRDELGLEPGPDLRQLHGRILAEDPALAGPPPPAPAPAPPPSPVPGIEHEPDGAPGEAHPVEVHLPHRTTTLVGREREAAELAALVQRARLVSLVGAAGCGKTRLAIEVARTVAHRFPDGVWFVDLTAARDGATVLSTVVSALGFAPADTGRPEEALRTHLRRRRALLVLDNCEQVLDPVADLVDDWFAGTTPLVVLATSREPLEVDGERVHRLGPLPLPEGDDDVTTSPAVTLLLDRLTAAGANRSDLGLLSAAVRIATAVDGVPLALELAAARARAFSLDEIAHQVTADPSSLARTGRGSDHHRTVRAAIEQSYALLPEDEAAAHRAVSVLPGPFTVTAADAVLDGSGAGPSRGAATADLVARLVHHSLLVPLGPARPGGPSRFAQLATIRGHAAHAAGPEAPALRGRRDAWVSSLALAKPPLGHVAEGAWFDTLDDDLPTLRATLQHQLLEVPSADGVRLAGRLGTFWYFRSKTIEGRTWAERALAVEHLADPLSAALVRLTLAHHLSSGGQDDLAVPHVTVAAGLLDGTEDAVSRTVAEVHTLLAHSLVVAGALEPARTVADAVAAAARAAGADPGLHLLAETCATLVESSSATTTAPGLAALHARALALGNVHVALLAAGMAVVAAIRSGDAATALSWSDRMIGHRLLLGTSDGPVAFELRAVATAMAGRPQEAVRLFAAARTQALRNALRWPAFEATPQVLRNVTAALDPGAAERARADGARLTLADVVDPPSAVPTPA
ncbi:BTAD domain-containing putative transcriptional regulator [Geodermatophilus sp. CPCC 206100]|uniref:AfsR/SARP family transcriptional regulator n=1 Tax=Geodermatophilus sp. CPCC 206100 TaxID=3020054 RepID=UPI003AFFB90F